MAVALCVAAAIPVQSQSPLPESSLRVRDGSGWTTWWTSQAPPATWGDSQPLARRLAWRDQGNGVAWAELLLAGDGEAWRTRLVVARLDPSRVRLELDTAFSNQRSAWTVDRMTRAGFTNVVLAVNAGQFTQASPWGLVVMHGHQYLPAALGPLATTLRIDSSGAIRWGHGAATASGAAFAFQSYPTLMVAGQIPDALRASGLGINTTHRDARLAIGSAADGTLVIAMTRFDGLGESFGAVPFGITSPEMAAVMGALGARDAVMLDGGISAQLFIRDRDGESRTWRGMRAVPLALIARRR